MDPHPRWPGLFSSGAARPAALRRTVDAQLTAASSPLCRLNSALRACLKASTPASWPASRQALRFLLSRRRLSTPTAYEAPAWRLHRARQPLRLPVMPAAHAAKPMRQHRHTGRVCLPPQPPSALRGGTCGGMPRRRGRRAVFSAAKPVTPPQPRPSRGGAISHPPPAPGRVRGRPSERITFNHP